MATPTLYDAYGRPIDRGVLTEELAAAVLAGIRTLWTNSIASGLTPQRLASILQRAVDNDHLDYLTLAEEIEERDAHYRSVLSTRKLAVSGLEVMVESASDDGADTKLAEAVRELVRAPEFGELVDDLLDGLGKGYSVVEMMWETHGRQWNPRYEWRDPRFFQFDLVSKSEVCLRDEADLVNGVALAPYKFIVHRPRLKTGIPIRGGLARMAVWAYLFKAYTIKDWMAFVEVYGIPMRLGRYGAGATDEDIKKLLSAVVNLGADAAAVIHDSMKIEFENAVEGTGNNDLFKSAAEWWDRQVSKLVLGQTATTEGTPGKLGNEQSQDQVRQDLVKADANQMGNTLNRHLVQPFIDLNFGPKERYPRIVLHVPEPEDLKQLTDALKTLVPMGMRVEQSVIRDKFGLPDPAEDAELLTAPAGPSFPPPPETVTNAARANNTAGRLPQAYGATAGNPGADSGTGFPDLDELEEMGMADWEEQLAPVLAPLRKAVDDATSYDDLVGRLKDVVGEIDTRKLAETLAKMLFLARAAGDSQDDAEILQSKWRFTFGAKSKPQREGFRYRLTHGRRSTLCWNA